MKLDWKWMQFLIIWVAVYFLVLFALQLLSGGINNIFDELLLNRPSFVIIPTLLFTAFIYSAFNLGKYFLARYRKVPLPRLLEWKWRQFLLMWLVIFLLRQSIDGVRGLSEILSIIIPLLAITLLLSIVVYALLNTFRPSLSLNISIPPTWRIIGWKWRQFLLTWLVVFWTVPSYGIHNFYRFGAPPPGSDLPPLPLFEPFGAVYFLGELFGQLTRGDIGDAFFIFRSYIIPFLFYTFILSVILYSAFSLMKSSIWRQKISSNP